MYPKIVQRLSSFLSLYVILRVVYMVVLGIHSPHKLIKKISVMKKLLQIVAVLVISSNIASAALINSLHVKNKGARGYKDIGEYEGLFIHRKWCLDPGMLSCPYICGETVVPNTETAGVKSSKSLMPFEIDFINSSLAEATASTQSNGLISQTFIVDGKEVVITARFSKSDTFFHFDIVENASYSDNIKELATISV